MAGTILGKPIQLGTSVIFAHLLGPAGYGLLGLTTAMAVALSGIVGLGFGEAVNKHVAEYYRRDREQGAAFASTIIWSGLITSAVLFVLLWLARALWVGFAFPHAVPSAELVICLCLAWLNLASALLLNVLTGLQLFREVTQLTLLQTAAVGVLGPSLSIFGLLGALAAYLGGTALCVLWAAGKLWRLDRTLVVPPRPSEFHLMRRVAHFSLPIWIGALAINPVNTFAFAFLAQQPSGARELGLFNTASALRMLITFLPGVVALVIGPSMLQEGGMRGDREAYQVLLDKSFTVLFFLTAPALILLLFWSDLLFLVYGRNFGASYRLFMPLVSSAAVGAVGAPLITALLARSKTWWSLGFGLCKSGLLICLTLLWAPAYLSTGLAWAFCISEVAFYVLALEFCVRVGAVPATSRRNFYLFCAFAALILCAALFTPDIWRWTLALPLSLASCILLLRTYPYMSGWLTDLLPGGLRPRAHRLLSLLAS